MLVLGNSGCTFLCHSCGTGSLLVLAINLLVQCFHTARMRWLDGLIRGLQQPQILDFFPFICQRTWNIDCSRDVTRFSTNITKWKVSMIVNQSSLWDTNIFNKLWDSGNRYKTTYFKIYSAQRVTKYSRILEPTCHLHTLNYGHGI